MVTYQCPNCEQQFADGSTDLKEATICPTCGFDLKVVAPDSLGESHRPEATSEEAVPPPLPEPVNIALLPKLRDVTAWRRFVDAWAVALTLSPWFFSPALGIAGINAAVFRVRAKARGEAIPAWPVITLLALWLLWMILSGWAVWLVRAAVVFGLLFLARKFRRDNDEMWNTLTKPVVQHAARRTLTLSWLIILLLIPGLVIGWTTHTLIEKLVGTVARMPTAEFSEYFPPSPPPPPMWKTGKYLAYKLDPKRFFLGEVHDTLVTYSGINNAPEQISAAARSIHNLLQFVWWIFIGYAFYVATRLYLYVFARVFVGGGGRFVLQLTRRS